MNWHAIWTQPILTAPSSTQYLSAMMKTATYSRVDDLDLKLDILLPTSPTVGALPGILHIHGGGMSAGSRSGLDCFEWITSMYNHWS